MKEPCVLMGDGALGMQKNFQGEKQVEKCLHVDLTTMAARGASLVYGSHVRLR